MESTRSILISMTHLIHFFTGLQVLGNKTPFHRNDIKIFCAFDALLICACLPDGELGREGQGVKEREGLGGVEERESLGGVEEREGLGGMD